MFRIIDFKGFKSKNPTFELISSHKERITFEYKQFINSDTIVEFKNEETQWFEVKVKDGNKLMGSFNLNFSHFADNRRKECQVDFNIDDRVDESQNFLNDYKAFVNYEGQLISSF